MGISLSGIGGFDTSKIVERLMQLERKAGKPLYRKKDSIDTTVKAYQNLNTQLAAMTKSAWAVFGKEDKFDETLTPEAVWGATKGVSSNSQVNVTTEAGASIGSVEFDVKQLAQSKQMIFDSSQVANLMDKGGSISIMVGNKVTNITPASTSMQDIAKAINGAKDSGVSATVVRTGDGVDGKGEYVLQITGKETGVDEGNFQLFKGDAVVSNGLTPKSTKEDLAMGTVTYEFEDANSLAASLGAGVAGQITRESSDAVITMYGKNMSYSSNNIELMDNVKVDISNVKQETKADGTPMYSDYLTKGVKIDVVGDPGAASTKVKAMVDSVNSIFSTLTKGMQSITKKGYTDDGKSYEYLLPGVLSNSIGRDVQSRLGDAIASGVTITNEDGTSQTYSLKDFGIDIKQSGSSLSLTFDDAKFKEATEADSTRAEKFISAFAEKIANVGNNLSDSKDGMLSKVIESEKTETDYFQARIDDFESRMITKETNMKRQYSALETMLASMQQQQSWLASQLAGLSSVR